MLVIKKKKKKIFSTSNYLGRLLIVTVYKMYLYEQHSQIKKLYTIFFFFKKNLLNIVL